MTVPLAPSLGPAIALWLARVSISQMDVPARQAYVVALVDPQERVAASAYTNTARYVSPSDRPGDRRRGANRHRGAFFIAGGLRSCTTC